MDLGMFFWILVIVAVAGGWWTSREETSPAARRYSWVFLFVLILVLGWKEFGPVLHR